MYCTEEIYTSLYLLHNTLSSTNPSSLSSAPISQDGMPTKRSRFLLDIPSELQVQVCATGAPLPNASLSRVLVVLTRAAAESRATALIRSRAGDIVTWEGLRALALGSRPYFLDRESNSLVGLGELTDIFFSE